MESSPASSQSSQVKLHFCSIFGPFLIYFLFILQSSLDNQRSGYHNLQPQQPQQPPQWPALNIKHERLEHLDQNTNQTELKSNNKAPVDQEQDLNEECFVTSPGINFDPRIRRFSTDELRPQPIIRKRKKV